ncbi:MAG TPA: thioesterase family protein [candidate division Zixibacteria bacterium]|nr:thioesterase family protein [candidate division Zixibacteria bacterium]
MDSSNQPSCAPVVHDARLRVRYAETDQMKVVYHSNYIVWMEVGRVELLRSLGYSYEDMEKDGYGLPVVEVHCRYRQPALYDDVVLIRTSIAQLRSKLIRFSYQILRESSGELLAEGESTHMVKGPDGKVTALPDKYMEPLRKAKGC